MPRPTKLTPEVQARLVAGIRHGLIDETAATVAGVTPRTLRGWLARGALPGRANAPHRALLAAVEGARAACEGDEVARILLASQRGSWRATAWLLERRYPERWGPPSRDLGPPDPDDYDPLTG